jgi:hypothetical protein
VWKLSLGNVHGIFNSGSELVLLVQCHSILDQESNARVQISHVPFEHKVLLALRRDLALQITEGLLSCGSATSVGEHTSREIILDLSVVLGLDHGKQL